MSFKHLPDSHLNELKSLLNYNSLCTKCKQLKQQFTQK